MHALGFDIWVTTPTGKIITVQVEHSDTIEDVKARVQFKEGIPSDQQLLFLSGRALEDERTISDYNMETEERVSLRLKPRGNYTALYIVCTL